MIWKLLGWLTSGPLDRLFSIIDKKITATTDRERLKTEALTSYVQAQAATSNSKQWWFPLFFIAPLGLWFSAVCVYSVLWCQGCVFPQDWSIAALPRPLDEWAGWIVGSLFVGKVGEALIAKFRGR